MKILQERHHNGDYVYKIIVNHKEVHRKVNTRASTFAHVRVYASDPWYNPQIGYIRALSFYQTLQPKPQQGE